MRKPRLSACAASIVIFLLTSNLNARDDGSDIQFVETAVVDGFRIGLTDEFGHTNSSPDHRLCFSIWTTNRSARVAFPTQPEYAYAVELFDTNGIALPRTSLGKRAGSRFLDFGLTSPKHGIKV